MNKLQHTLSGIAIRLQTEKQSRDRHARLLSRDDKQENSKSRTKLLSVSLIVLIALLSLNLSPHFDVIASKAKQSQDKSAVSTQYAQLPLAFEPNQGQVNGNAQFLVHHGQATTYFDGASTTTAIGNNHITMSLDGANTPSFDGTDQLESKTNYFIGNDQSKWHSDVPNFKNLLAKNVYPGIDLKYYGTNSELEHDFIVSPGTDYKQIAFHFDGQENLSLDSDGNLVLKTGGSDLRLNAPTTYQQTSHEKHTIPSHFELNGNTITIALNADYDHSQPLVIDPALVYSTYLGGTGNDFGRSIVTDSSGNAYLTGQTFSTDFPLASAVQGTNGGGEDAFVTKLNSTGSALVYTTYLGGSGTDQGISIAIDGSNNAYLTGLTDSTNFPLASAFQGANASGEDAFVTKLNAAGSALVYSTYLGGTGQENGRSIAVDTSNNAYITGPTTSTDFPTASPYQASSGGTDDIFFTKFNAAGSAQVFSTYLGGSSSDFSFGITVDSSDSAYIIGFTTSTDFPTASPYQASNAGGYDVTATRFDSSGASLIYSTYLGGSGTDFGRAITIDSSGNAYLTGLTDSTNYPTYSPFQATNGGGFDAFITKIDAAGSALTYSTYLGGNSDDQGLGIAIDASDQVHLAGLTGSANFPSILSYQGTKAAGDDVFLTKIDTNGLTMLYSTFLGGGGSDYSLGLTVGTNGNAYITGLTDSSDFPTSLPLQGTNAGGSDAFIAQIVDQPLIVTGIQNPSLSFTISSTLCDLGVFSATQTQSCTHTMSAATNATGGYVISYIPTTTLTSGANTLTAMAAQTSSVISSEQFGMNLKANTSAGSFTAANFGADPTGGSGVALTDYNSSDLFKFTVGGEDIAQSPVATNLTTFTASFIANITTASEAGTYSTPVTYNIVPNF